MPIDTKANLRSMINRLEDELAENLDNRKVAARLRKRIDDLTRELADAGGYFASNPRATKSSAVVRAEAMQVAYSKIGNALFELKRHLEGIEKYFSVDQTHEAVEIRFKARDLASELDKMIHADEWAQLNDDIFFLAEMMKGRSKGSTLGRVR